MKSDSQGRLSLCDAISIIIGVIVGAGVFETAPAIASSCGSWQEVLELWVLGGVLSLCGALVYAELSTSFPEDGGEMVYLREAFGETVSYLFAWSRFVIVQPGSISAMSFVFVRYFVSALDGLGVSLQFETYFLACVLVGLITLVNLAHSALVVSVQNLLSFLTVTILVLIFSTVFLLPDVLVAFSALEKEVFVTDQGSAVPFGVALVLVLFTYGGWSELAMVASEVKKPEKNLFRALVCGVILVTLLYVGINASFLLVLGHEGVVQSNAVVADTLSKVFPSYSAVVVSLVICVCVLGSIQAMTYTGARLNAALGKQFPSFSFLSVSRDGAGRLWTALLSQGCMSVGIILLTQSFSGTVVYTSAIVWFFFLLTGISFLIIRVRCKDARRPYKVPLAPFVSMVFILSSAYLFYSAITYDMFGAAVSVLLVLLGFPARSILRKFIS